MALSRARMPRLPSARWLGCRNRLRTAMTPSLTWKPRQPNGTRSGCRLRARPSPLLAMRASAPASRAPIPPRRPRTSRQTKHAPVRRWSLRLSPRRRARCSDGARALWGSKRSYRSGARRRVSSTASRCAARTRLSSNDSRQRSPQGTTVIRNSQLRENQRRWPPRNVKSWTSQTAPSRWRVPRSSGSGKPRPPTSQHLWPAGSLRPRPMNAPPPRRCQPDARRRSKRRRRRRRPPRKPPRRCGTRARAATGRQRLRWRRWRPS
mmetsp:Transcript_19139/g.59421  ORF Transcript_19139/g.59421 Transcript_19139/m.59421 type:complete len:264 (+) Transcript_19139:194-985(+)